MAIETSNPLMEGESTSMFQMEKTQICTLLTNSIKGLNRSTNKNVQTFWQVWLLEELKAK